MPDRSRRTAPTPSQPSLEASSSSPTPASPSLDERTPATLVRPLASSFLFAPAPARLPVASHAPSATPSAHARPVRAPLAHCYCAHSPVPSPRHGSRRRGCTCPRRRPLRDEPRALPPRHGCPRPPRRTLPSLPLALLRCSMARPPLPARRSSLTEPPHAPARLCPAPPLLRSLEAPATSAAQSAPRPRLTPCWPRPHRPGDLPGPLPFPAPRGMRPAPAPAVLVWAAPVVPNPLWPRANDMWGLAPRT